MAMAMATAVAAVQAVRVPPQRKGYVGLRRGWMSPIKCLQKDLAAKLVASIKEAEETCAENEASGECVVAWDQVEELSAATADAKRRVVTAAIDPLELYCNDHPEAEECRIYEV